MILTIEINKEMPGIYAARAHEGGQLVTEPETYGTINSAIREQALSLPEGFAHFVEFRYGGMSTGTFAVAELPAMAAELADRPVALNAEMHIIGEAMKSAARLG